MTISLSMADAMKDVTLEISIHRPAIWSLRMWLATQLVRLASAVFPLTANVRVNNESKDSCDDSCRTYTQSYKVDAE